MTVRAPVAAVFAMLVTVPGAAWSLDAPTQTSDAYGPANGPDAPEAAWAQYDASQAPPAPPAVAPAPPAQPEAYDTQSATAGQWVNTDQYGWIWMPYSDAYTSVPANGYGEPYQYVYYPPYQAWTWVVAPWIWGIGPWPYFGAYGPARFGWYGHGWWRSPARWHFAPGPYRGFVHGGVRPVPFRSGFGVHIVRPAPIRGGGFVGHGAVGGHVGGGARVGGGAHVRSGGGHGGGGHGGGGHGGHR